MRYRIFVQRVAIVLMLALRIPGAALAHDGPSRLELNRQQTSSGAELEIRGVNIAAEQPIMLALVGADHEYPLGTAIGDEHGDFVIGVRLPAEALAGAYTVRAFGANRVVVAAPLTLVGSANEEGGERRDQSELMLAPIPQSQPAQPVQPQQSQPAQPAQPQQPIIQPAQPAAPAISPPASTTTTLWYGLVALVALMLAASLVLLWRRRSVRTGEVSR
jgi:hypothetical protein